jgi:hypothetical protein
LEWEFPQVVLYCMILVMLFCLVTEA